jgi:uncharacterized membrane protein required for colicin V production
MIWIEIACACALIYGLISGWKNGLFEELVSAGGFLVGLGIAYIYYKTVGCNIWAFIFITLGTPLVLGLLATLITKVLDHIYFAGFINHLLGAILGCFKWAIVVGLILLILDRLEPLRQSLSSLLKLVPGL